MDGEKITRRGRIRSIIFETVTALVILFDVALGTGIFLVATPPGRRYLAKKAFVYRMREGKRRAAARRAELRARGIEPETKRREAKRRRPPKVRED